MKVKEILTPKVLTECLVLIIIMISITHVFKFIIISCIAVWLLIQLYFIENSPETTINLGYIFAKLSFFLVVGFSSAYIYYMQKIIIEPKLKEMKDKK